RFFSALAAQKQGLTLEAIAQQIGMHPPPEDPTALATMWLHELDRHHVARASLIASVPGDDSSVLQAASAHPDRFFPAALFNPRDWKPSSIDVACLFPAMHRYSVQDPMVLPVFEWAAANRKAVFAHCGVLSVGIRGKLGLDSRFDMRFSN